MNYKSKYISSAFLLLLTSVIVKIIGAVYKIPLTSFIGAVGRGYFATAYNLYLPIHALIMGSFPVALSRITGKYSALNNKEAIVSLKKAADKLFLKVGLIGCIAMLLLAKPYCSFIASSDKSFLSAAVLAPSILFSALAASGRGYYEGFMNMRPTSVSQIVESLFKMIFGLIFAKLSMAYLYNEYLQKGTVLGEYAQNEEAALSMIYPITSAAAMLGVTLGCLISFIYVVIYHQINKPDIKNVKITNPEKYSAELLSFSFPIMISCAVQSVFQFLDTASVQAALSLINTNYLKTAFASGLTISKTASDDVGAYVYGILSTAVDFKNLVPGITMALGVCAVPALSRAFELKDREHLESLVSEIYKYTAVISLGGGLIIAINSEDILKLFYSSSSPDIVLSTESLVRHFALTVPFYSLAGTSVFCVQALGKPKKTIAPYVISGIIRVILNILLVSNESLILEGSVISGAVGYFIMFLMNTRTVRKTGNVKIYKKNIYIKPIIISFVLYFFLKYAFENINFSSTFLINLLIKSAVSGLLFCMLCFLLKVLIFGDVFCVLKSKKNGLNT